MSQPSSELNKFEELIQVLGKKSPEDDLELTGQEIAEILWLALKRQEFEQPADITDVSIDNSEKEAEKIAEIISKQLSVLPFVRLVEQRLYKLALLSLPIKKTPKIPPKTPPKQNISHSQSSTKAPVYTSSRSTSSQDLPIGIPDAPSLREPLNLLKSLRLLMQKVPSGRKAGIDEEATVRRIAEEQLWIPVLQEEVEPWLDLALVIDESQSMLIWGHTIADLQCLFQKYGIFRELKVWGIKLDSTKTKVEFIARHGNSNRIAEPKELIDLTRRRLILIISDCVSNLWRQGIIFPTLNFWAEKQPLAIIQMLPRVMWRRSALGLGMLVNFNSSTLGVANKDLVSSKVAPLPNVTKIPILSLERKPILEQTPQPEDKSIAKLIFEEKYQQIYDWTEMLVGKRESLVSGYLLPPELNIKAHPLLVEQQEAIKNQNAAQRIERFRKMTSILGRKLAGLLAAAPVISLPIVRLIQESLLPDSGQIQVAEVFLGGLLKPKPEFISNGNLNPEAVEYEYIQTEIRDLFLEDAPVSDSTDVLNAVSRYVAEQMGFSLSEFMGLLKSPTRESDKQDQIRPFAEVTVRILKKLGGDYLRLAEEIGGTVVEDRGGDQLNERHLLWQQGKTKIFSLQTNTPWTIPFDAFVISTSRKVNLGGSLARSLNDYIGEHNFDELVRVKDIALNQRHRREIPPEYPLIFSLPASINALLNFQDNGQEHFIICATVESPKATIKNVEIAVEATLRLIAERGLKRVVLTLFGTGNNPLPIFPVAEITLSTIAGVLTVLSSHSLEEITVVSRSERTIAAINQVAKKIQNKIVDYSQLTNLLAAGKWKEAELEILAQQQAQQQVIKEQNAAQRIESFRRMSSPLGRKLVGLLAAAPVISLPIVLLIQESLLPESGSIQIAEVFLGGLLQPELEITSEANSIQYKFIEPEIRDMLLEDAPVSDSTDVFNAVSRYVAEQMGITLRDFMALLKSPTRESDKQDITRSFAEVTVRILEKRGEDFLRLRDYLRNIYDLQTLDVIVAKITFDPEPEPPQQLEFETVTVNSSGQVIKTQTHQAFYYEEPLADNIPPLVMMGIPEGEFIMGSPEDEPQRDNDESPQHQVKVAPFWLAQTPITNAQWNFVANLPQIQRKLNSKESNREDDHPVTRVSWYDAMEFCARLFRYTGRDYRLPSEAEWEYACRAGTKTPFHFGATITSELASYDATYTYADEPSGEYQEKTVPVKSFSPNAFGLYDMHGQVREWCADPWHDNYEDAPEDSRVWDELDNNDNHYQNIAENLAELLKDERERIMRGGSWFADPGYCRSASRYGGDPVVTSNFIGFRVACGGART